MNIYYNNFIDFFTKYGLYDKEMFDYLRKNSIMFDYLDDEERVNIGFYPVYNKAELKKIVLFVPYINSDITSFINVHEYVHGILAYNKLGKKYKYGYEVEILPIVFERLFVQEYLNDKLLGHKTYLDNCIKEDSELKYQLGLKYQEEFGKYISNGYNTGDVYRKDKKSGVDEENKLIKKLRR